MRGLRRRFLLFVFSVLFCSTFLFLPAYAANSIEFEGYQFLAQTIYQGDSGVHVDLDITNSSNSSIVVHGASVHFDWQASNESFVVGSQRSGEPFDLGKELQSAGQFVMRIRFSVPGSVSVGGHLFYFRVFYNNGLEVQWNPREKDPYAELTIHSLYEPQYPDIKTSIEEDFAQAQDAGFISPEARSFVTRAEEHLSEAQSYAEGADWQSAVARLSAASYDIEQAYEAEEKFRTYLIIGSAIGVGSVIGAGLLVRRQRKKRSLKLSNKKLPNNPNEK